MYNSTNAKPYLLLKQRQSFWVSDSMVSVYLVDYEGELLFAGGSGLSSAIVCDNEILALNKVAGDHSAVVVLHYAVRNTGTEEFIGLLKSANSAAQVVVVGHDLQDEQVIALILAGAKGYQNIDSFGQYAEKLIRVVSDGEAWVSRKMVGKLIDYWRSQ